MKHIPKLIYVLLVLVLISCGGESTIVDANIDASAKQNASIPEIKNFDHYMRIIPLDKKWMEKIKVQAGERSISVDAMLVLSAKFMAKKNGYPVVEVQVKDLDFYIKKIKNDDKWLKSVEKQAAERSISVDSMLTLSAEYLVKKQLKE